MILSSMFLAVAFVLPFFTGQIPQIGSMLCPMLIGRIVWGIAMFICMSMSGGRFGFSAFITGAVTNAVPGMIVQIILIPAIVMLLMRRKL